MKPPKSSQSGSTLLISLVLLVMLTLFVLTVINTTNINSRIAGNMQTVTEAQAAAQQAIEEVISTPNFSTNPQPVTVVVNTGNNKTYTVSIAKPECISIVPIKTIELDITNPNDAPCLGSGAVTAPGIAGLGGAGNSLCSNSQWDISATVTEAATSGVSVTVHQGAAVRVPIGTTC
ncbi:MAG TPA: PilX N-terminal domain-containing pilus assembly protein [Candidatus Obscuribacterales bacterium]